MENNTLTSTHTTEFPWRFLLGIGLFALGGTMWAELVQEPGQKGRGSCWRFRGFPCCA